LDALALTALRKTQDVAKICFSFIIWFSSAMKLISIKAIFFEFLKKHNALMFFPFCCCNLPTQV